MELSRNICTCGDRECLFQPANPDQVCTLFIEKNLKAGEIPSCFFHKYLPENPDRTGYTYVDFAREVMQAEYK